MSFFQFPNLDNARQQNRNKLPKIDIDLDPFKMFTSLFSNKNTANVRSCCESCNAKFSLIKTKVSVLKALSSFKSFESFDSSMI